MRKNTKKIIALILCLIMTASLLTGCGEVKEKSSAGSKETESVSSGVISNSSQPVEKKPVEEDHEEPQEELTPEEAEAQEAFATSTPENDTDIGLRSIKIDTAMNELSEEHADIIRYFDNDYLSIQSYEFPRRYPMVFENAQVTITGAVFKVLSQVGMQYELLLDMSYYLSERAGSDLVLITGTVIDACFIEGDRISVYGVYDGLKTIDVDGKSITVPSILAYDASLDNRFDYTFIKRIAKAIFGEDIEVRTLTAEEANYSGNVKKCAVGKHPKSEKLGSAAHFSEVERSGT